MATRRPRTENLLDLDSVQLRFNFVHTPDSEQHTEITLQGIPTRDYALGLFIGNEALELRTQDNQTWTPAQRPGVSPTSQIRVEIQMRIDDSLRAQKRVATEIIDLQSVFDDYWGSNKCEFTVPKDIIIVEKGHQYRWSLELQFSARAITETLHSSLHQTQGLLAEYSPLMSRSTEKVIKDRALPSTERVGDRNALDQARVSEILEKFAAQSSEGAQKLAQEVIASFNLYSSVSEKARLLDIVDGLVVYCDDAFHRHLAKEGFFQMLISDEKVQGDRKFRNDVQTHLATWLGSLSGRSLEIASDVFRLLSDSSKGESSSGHQLGSSNPRGASDRGPREVITFQTPKLEKRLFKFLLSSYIQAGDILRKSRRVKWFSLQAIHIARQAFHLIIWFNDFIGPDGPASEHYDEGMDLDDALEELEDKIDALEKLELDEAIRSEEDHKYDLARFYQIFFTTRDFYPNGRDYKTDPVLKRLVDSDHATLILARHVQARGPHNEGCQDLGVHGEGDIRNQGPISDVGVYQAEPDDAKAVPALTALGPQEPPIDESLRVAPGSEAVHDAIRDLLADEYPDLAAQHGSQVQRQQYLEINQKTFIRYLKFVEKTWAGVASSFACMLFSEISPYCFLKTVFFSILVTFVLTIGVFVCVLAKAPFIHRVFVRYLNTWYGGVYITNTIGRLSHEETNAAMRALAAPEWAGHKEFNLDIAKLLLLFASIMYERTSSTKREAIKDAVLRQRSPPQPGLALLKHFPHPGGLIRDVFGRAGLTNIRQILKRSSNVGRIQQFMRRMEIEFEPVSELSSMSSAYSALFWDANSNWIVVAFKGTSPTEFDEWITNFDITRVPADDDLPGYGNFHRGFKERIFPEKSTSSRSPYETIVRGVDIVSQDLIERLECQGESAEINVYFTGHSLGCATSTLAYIRMINEDNLDPRVRIMDAYLFAAPAVCDMTSVRVFNQRMAHSLGRRKTMWRIVNENDVVATGLPSLGDRPTFKYPDIIFAFAHLGMEITMRKRGTGCTQATIRTSGAVVRPKWGVSVISERPPALVGVIPRGKNLPLWKGMLQHLPIIGRLFAHFPEYYWESLRRMGTGDTFWVLQ